MRWMIVLGALTMLGLEAQEYTRGVGVYPGDPRESFGPTLRVDDVTYRNLALRRPAYHSSSYDYNLTAQLVTDGIKDTTLPRWVVTSTSQDGVLAKNVRERVIDDNWPTFVNLKGGQGWVQLELAGGDSPLDVDRVDVQARVQNWNQAEEWSCTVLGSDDGNQWRKLGASAGISKPGGEVNTSVALAAPSRSRFYRLQFDDPRALGWQVAEIAFFRASNRVHVGGPYSFTSAWMAAGDKSEWVYVDLGARCTFDRVALYWIRRPTEGAIEVSDDAAHWTAVQSLPAKGGAVDDLKLAQPVQGRYVRVLLTRPATPEGYVLSELEVYGRGGLVPEPKPVPVARKDGRLDLAGGAWRIERDSAVSTPGEVLSKPGFDDHKWLVATVPGVALASYYNAGALPDPNFADNLLMVSDSYFWADFWYRNEFTAPPSPAGRRIWLNFDGINWKADVFLNGEKIGRIEGAFQRGRFDVTKLLHAGQKNALAVRIEKTASPGSVKEKTFENPDKNGGALGSDNPTFHATVGWDWIPTIPGRDIGIWNNVYLSASGPVTIEKPFVSATLPLPDTSRADVSIEVTLKNHTSEPVSGTLEGRFGDAAFQAPVTIEAAAEKTVKLDPSSHPTLRISSPTLWWPNGYGDPNLYSVELKFETADKRVSDAKSFQTGIRQFTYRVDDGALKIWINGRRFIPRGGNWGFGELLLRYRAREFDAAVRYHREMNLNTIRNWVGQIGEDEFYEACDRHGIVVWQDFWLANPWDGPDPADNTMFVRNARDTIERIRNHPSLGIYCGRNEGYPPKALDDALEQLVATLHPGTYYLPSSADGPVSGHGPYQAMPAKFYFSQRSGTKLHSEMGMPNIVTLDSLRLMMPEDALWPLSRMWGLHDFCRTGAQGGASFIERIEKSLGPVDNVADWVRLAQFVNYDGYRAMYEAQSRNRMGLLIWMSHPAWPSLVWQTYDYYFEPTAAYFGVKKANEPLHIQWNAAADNVEVVNYSGGDARGLTARAEIVNLDGAMKWERTATLDSSEDSVATPIKLEFPAGLTPVYFIRLRLMRGGEAVSENLYWRGLEPDDFHAFRNLPRVKLEAKTSVQREGERWRLTTSLRNPSAFPAVMVRLKAVRQKSGDRILPAIYSDNYVTLMPGEDREIVTELRDADTRGEAPTIVIEGFNTETAATPAPPSEAANG
jgi:hypothetical protein